MSRRTGLWGAGAALAAATALAFASAPAGACACGIAIDATVTEESALVVERPGGEQIVLSLDPMRLAQLGQVPIAITLYTLADGPRTTEWLSEAWSGEVGELSPRPPAKLAGLFAAGTWVTRLEASGVEPSTFNEDLVVEAVPAPATTEAASTPEAVVPVTEEDSGISTGGVIALIVAGLAFALALAVATRR